MTTQHTHEHEPQPPIFLFNWTMAKVTDHEMSQAEMDALKALVNEAMQIGASHA